MDGIITNQPVVIDNGSGVLKAGIAGDSEPKISMPAIVGRPKHTRVMQGALEEERLLSLRSKLSSKSSGLLSSSSADDDLVVVGDRASELRGLLTLTYPVSHGRVTRWDDMERLWSATYSQLAVRPEEHPVLLSEPPLNPRRHREQAAEVFFETFNAPALFLSVQAVLSLFASGRTTGVVLDVGDGVSHVVPIYEGYSMTHAIQRIDLAGRDVTEYLQQLLRRSGDGIDLHTSAEKEIVKHIKETACYVASDPAKEEYRLEADAKSNQLVEYRLPDGNIIQIGPEAFRAPEILFRPDLIGEEYPGVQQCVVNAIHRSDLDLRKNLYANVVLAGGSTMFPGFGKRLLEELVTLAPKDTKIKISAPPERKNSTWIGGSILASLATFRKMWVSREEYRECGANVIHRKCF